MKKTYIEPSVKIVKVDCESVLTGTSGNTINMSTTEYDSTGEIQSKSGSFWDEDDEDL